MLKVQLEKEEEYKEWLRNQSSWLSEGRPCVPCHVRRVSMGSGTSRKPPFWMVPMTWQEHHMQTVRGELFTLIAFGLLAPGDTVQMAKDIFDTQAENHLIKYMKEKNIPSLMLDCGRVIHA